MFVIRERLYAQPVCSVCNTYSIIIIIRRNLFFPQKDFQDKYLCSVIRETVCNRLTKYFKFMYFEACFLSSMSIINQEACNEVHLTSSLKGFWKLLENAQRG